MGAEIGAKDTSKSEEAAAKAKEAADRKAAAKAQEQAEDGGSSAPTPRQGANGPLKTKCKGCGVRSAITAKNGCQTCRDIALGRIAPPKKKKQLSAQHRGVVV